MISSVIMAHPSRREFVRNLQGQLDRDVDAVWDRLNDRWETGRRSLLAFDPSAEHHLVIQDDAVPCQDLVAGIEKACEAAAAAGHTGPCAFYAGRQRPVNAQFQATVLIDHARRNGASWIEMEGPWWGVAIAVPTVDVPALVEWCDDRPDIANYDKRISRCYAERGKRCWYSVPSLVDHRSVAENPSLVAGRTGDRHAHWFIGRDRSALEVDWTKTPRGGQMPTHRNVKTGHTMKVKDGSSMERVLSMHPDWERATDEPEDAKPEPAATPAEPKGEPEGETKDLGDLTRIQLNNLAREKGIADPDKFPNKGAVIETIEGVAVA